MSKTMEKDIESSLRKNDEKLNKLNEDIEKDIEKYSRRTNKEINKFNNVIDSKLMTLDRSIDRYIRVNSRGFDERVNMKSRFAHVYQKNRDVERFRQRLKRIKKI